MTALLALPESLTGANAAAAVQAAAAAARSAGRWQFDASGIQRFDSTAIASLLELRRQADGQPFAVTGTPAAMKELAGLYGVAELLNL
jgi:phospholipid transport system transporter-binding protein